MISSKDRQSIDIFTEKYLSYNYSAPSKIKVYVNVFELQHTLQNKKNIFSLLENYLEYYTFFNFISNF